MICDKCKYTAAPLVEVITGRWIDHEDYDHNIQTTETEEWCLTCIAGKETPTEEQERADNVKFQADFEEHH